MKKELEKFIEAYNNIDCEDEIWNSPISLESLKKDNGILGMAAITNDDDTQEWQVSIDTNDWSFVYEINGNEVLREAAGLETVIESLGADFDEWIQPLYELGGNYKD